MWAWYISLYKSNHHAYTCMHINVLLLTTYIIVQAFSKHCYAVVRSFAAASHTTLCSWEISRICVRCLSSLDCCLLLQSANQSCGVLPASIQLNSMGSHAVWHINAQAHKANGQVVVALVENPITFLIYIKSKVAAYARHSVGTFSWDRREAFSAALRLRINWLLAHMHDVE